MRSNCVYFTFWTKYSIYNVGSIFVWGHETIVRMLFQCVVNTWRHITKRNRIRTNFAPSYFRLWVCWSCWRYIYILLFNLMAIGGLNKFQKRNNHFQCLMVHHIVQIVLLCVWSTRQECLDSIRRWKLTSIMYEQNGLCLEWTPTNYIKDDWNVGFWGLCYFYGNTNNNCLTRILPCT